MNVNKKRWNPTLIVYCQFSVQNSWFPFKYYLTRYLLETFPITRLYFGIFAEKKSNLTGLPAVVSASRICQSIVTVNNAVVTATVEINKSELYEGCSKSKVTSIFASYVHLSFEFLLLLCCYTRHDHMFTVLTIIARVAPFARGNTQKTSGTLEKQFVDFASR